MSSRSSPLPKLDPVIPAIHEWRLARAEALLAEATTGGDGSAFDAALAARSKTMARALTTVPTTRDGLRAFCEFGAELSMVLPLDSDCSMSEFSPLGSATSVSRTNCNSAEALFFRTLVQAATMLPAAPVTEGMHHG